jgi:hypothetical protein
MHFELWTVPTGNIVDDFASEDEALALVCELIDGMSPQAADALLLTLVRDDGTGVTIATGAALADRARRHAAREARRPYASADCGSVSCRPSRLSQAIRE